MTTDAKKEETGYVWNFVAELGNGRQFAMTGNFPKGMSADNMNAEVDKISAVFNRQQARSAAIGAAQEIERQELQLKKCKEDLAALDERYSAKGGPSSQEKEQRKLAATNVLDMQMTIDYKKGVLAKLQDEAK